MDTKAFREGFRDGIPIGLGYLAVSFSLGISAKQAGLTPLQGFVTSFLENASAGEYIAFTLIGAGATYIELCLMTIIANARYLLMSCAMSQRFSPDTPMIHRFLVAFDPDGRERCSALPSGVPDISIPTTVTVRFLSHFRAGLSEPPPVSSPAICCRVIW